MKYIAYTIGIIIALALQAGLFGYFKIWNTVPNLLLLMVITLSLEKEDYDFFIVSAIAGLFLDLYSGSFPGTFMFGFLFTAYLLHLTAQSVVVYETNWKYLAGFLLGAMLASYLWAWGYSNFVFKLGWWPMYISGQDIRHIFLAQLLYNAVLAYPVFNATRRVKEWATKFFSRQQVIR